MIASTNSTPRSPWDRPGDAPSFGPNVIVFDPSMPTSAIQAKIDAVYRIQQHNHFGPERHALLFKPGSYRGLTIPVGFYTQVLGLGASPDGVSIEGDLRSDAYLANDNATQNFLRAAEGFAVTPSPAPLQWAVSQAVPFRRMHVRGDIKLNQNNGWTSGGWMADVLIEGSVNSGSQQQWVTRNSQLGSWLGAHWNMVYVGVVNPPEGSWPARPYTTLAQTPLVREKPFLVIAPDGAWGVRVPALRANSAGITWADGATPGTTIPLEQFYIAQPGESAAALNSRLAAGKHLILTPGVYELDGPLQVQRAGTVVLGLGFATLHSDTGLPLMTVADVDGVTIAGLFFDAGTAETPVLLELGPRGSSASHAANPTALHDVFFRVGGAGASRATVCMCINSHDVIVDHTWIWRADHGSGVGWATNPSANGLIVNGDNVTIYGLFVEHFQEYQVLWNGNGGRTYFYQSELPYDPPSQASWSSAPGVDGWASYKVADHVTSHEAWGLGIYSVFTQPEIWLTRAVEAPRSSAVKFHNIVTVCIGRNGGIGHVVNDVGGPTEPAVTYTPRLTQYP